MGHFNFLGSDKKVKFAFLGGYAALSFLNYLGLNQQFHEMKERHPNSNIKAKFNYLPGIGGYWSFEPKEKANQALDETTSPKP
ncbi:MAG: hypothetical protein LCH30_06705 [Proteobacteria bacterium]|nr:hypothetical protein [Pseudomonadota bacterium]